MSKLTRWEYIRAVVAKWIIINIAARISPLAVLSFCLEVAKDYQDRYIEDIEIEEPEINKL